MFLIRTSEKASFFLEDPRNDGYQGLVEEGVFVENPNEDFSDWHGGTKRPMQCIGRSPTNPKQFRFFGHPDDRAKAGYQPEGGFPVIHNSLKEYKALLADAPCQEPGADQ